MPRAIPPRPKSPGTRQRAARKARRLAQDQRGALQRSVGDLELQRRTSGPPVPQPPGGVPGPWAFWSEPSGQKGVETLLGPSGGAKPVWVAILGVHRPFSNLRVFFCFFFFFRGGGGGGGGGWDVHWGITGRLTQDQIWRLMKRSDEHGKAIGWKTTNKMWFSPTPW